MGLFQSKRDWIGGEDELIDEIAALQLENSQLKGVLHFYANIENWRKELNPDHPLFEGPKRAETILKKFP